MFVNRWVDISLHEAHKWNSFSWYCSQLHFEGASQFLTLFHLSFPPFQTGLSPGQTNLDRYQKVTLLQSALNAACRLFSLSGRDAPHTNAVRQRLHLQGVHLPVCQLLLVALLRGFLQGKVRHLSGWNHSCHKETSCSQQDFKSLLASLCAVRFVGYPTNYGTLFGMRNEDVSIYFTF